MVKFGNIEVFKKYNCRRVKITTDEGKPLMLIIKDCLSWGIKKNKFDKTKYQIPLVVTERQDFIDKINKIKDACLQHLKREGVEVTDLKSFHQGQNGSITLYCNLADGVRLRHESDKTKGLTVKDCPQDKTYVHAAIVVESISITEKSTNLKTTVKEIMFLDKKDEGEEWADVF